MPDFYFYFQMTCTMCEIVGLAFVTIFVFSISSRAQYYVKILTFALLSIFLSSICIPLMLRRPRDYRNALIPAWLVVKTGQLVGVSFEIQGIENIKKDDGGIVLINHQSLIDLIGEIKNLREIFS